MCDARKTNHILYLAASIDGLEETAKNRLAAEIREAYADSVTGEVSREVFSALVSDVEVSSLSLEAQRQLLVIRGQIEREGSHSRVEFA